MTNNCLIVGRNAFNNIKNANSNLHMEMVRVEHDYVDLEMNIDVQNGLDFPILMNLQDDALHLHVGPFWGEWFSCESPEVVKNFVDAVNGVLSGCYRIKVISRAGKEVKALLQAPSDGSWKLYYTWSKLHWPFGKKTIHYIQNSRVGEEL